MRNLFSSIILIAVSFLALAQSNSEGIRKGPNFKLENLDGDMIELNKEVGDGPVLLSFWATWCKPCLEELVEYKKIYNEFKDQGFKMYAISTDDEKTVAKVKPLVSSKSYNFPVLLDTNSEIARLYYAQAMPYSVILDKDGFIIYSHLGYMKGDEIKVRDKISEQLKK